MDRRGFTRQLKSVTVAVLTMPVSYAVADPLQQLAFSARDGEVSAFNELYERTREMSWAVLYKVVGPSPDLEDLLQEAYLQLMRSLKRYRGESKVTTFLHRICVNVGLMHLRGRKRRPEDVVEELPHAPAGDDADPERQAQVQQASQLVQKALATMSEEKASVFAYHELLGLKPEEISELVNAPVNTVRSRLNRARVDFTEAVAVLTKGGGR
jgi:RNA polymerase sigma-70 factor (ECF subfamily)